MRAGEWAGMEPPWLHYPAWMAPTYQRGRSNHQVLVLAVGRASPLSTRSEGQVWRAGFLLANAGRDTRNARQLALWTLVGSESLRERQVCAWWGQITLSFSFPLRTTSPAPQPAGS